MLSYVLKRIGSLIPTLLVVSVVVFLVVFLIPGGPATAILGMEATAEELAALNAELGFDRNSMQIKRLTEFFVSFPYPGTLTKTRFLKEFCPKRM